MHINSPTYLSYKSTNSMCVGHKTRRYTTQELDPFGLNTSILDVSLHITAYKTKSGTSVNCIEECQHHISNIHVFYFVAVTVYFWHFTFNTVCKLVVLVLYMFVLCLPENGDLLLKHVGGLMYMDDVWFFILYKLCAYFGVYGWL